MIMHEIRKTYKNLRTSTMHGRIGTHHTTPHHETLMYTQTRKHTVSVTLDIECYDDLDLKNIDWSDILGLEGDENVYVTTKESGEDY